jgi:hypothetical protein
MLEMMLELLMVVRKVVPLEFLMGLMKAAWKADYLVGQLVAK